MPETKLKVVSGKGPAYNVQGGERDHSVIFVDITDEESLPYVFWPGDRIIITEDGRINTDRANPGFEVEYEPDYAWFEKRINELEWKILNAIQKGHFISQTDVYERNYLKEIYNSVVKAGD